MTRTTLDRHDIGPGVEIHSVGGHTAPRRKDAWVRYFLDPEESRHNRGGAYRSGALRYERCKSESWSELPGIGSRWP
ncbi:hypothetical protein CH63R_04396 [Colletotrichum higginsianum IMI 349063]|uniref:Uncharacterized protein n=1 Tax=Colletotrichum higginsianum (strain IMI 349063) TaxID=759273 RepID=A0A1B7YJA6_COLHI|nr:hypothetical protein CH63R_04396 [Colletotrichum higginsianum IMI 349063]OBR12100.1 hypothetical protein CH63R_04396 [Colletotrichum higginsianum IMI 349063]GJC93776.1 hypothetical protein ColKHC_02602 [Colletotrichum higginsianum]